MGLLSGTHSETRVSDQRVECICAPCSPSPGDFVYFSDGFNPFPVTLFAVVAVPQRRFRVRCCHNYEKNKNESA
ncbi:hypothetical protein ACSQ67_018832 [Phaseolus vulgaris]